MHRNLIFLSVISVLLISGIFFLLSQKEPNKEDFAGRQTAVIKNEKGQEVTSISSNTDFSGIFLAGKNSPYIEFNNTDYKKARKDNEIIFLEFYANWCPICRAQEPKLFDGFNALTNDNVVGFRVNYNDDQTDDVEKQLAKDFGVTYQHTHVILKDGKVVSKSNDDLEKESFVRLIESVSK